MFPALCSISEGGRKVSSEAFFLFQDEYQYFSPTTRLPSHKDTGIGVVASHETNGGMKRVLESKPANRVLRSGNNIPTSLTPTELRSADMQLSMGMPLLYGDYCYYVHACKN